MDITATDFLKEASNTAEYFGFKNAAAFKKNPQCKKCDAKFNHNASAVDRRNDSLHGMLTAGINAYTDQKLYAIEEEPVLYYSLEQVPRSGEAALSLQVFGVKKSIAEAILIQTAQSLTESLGFDNYAVRINSLGDKDSSTRYIRELTNYLKKRIEDMPPTARELMKEHVYVALMHLVEKEHELAYKSPNPLEYLNDNSRKHFREIIEYLDMSETLYEIDPKLIGHHLCYSDAIFAIDLLEGDQKMEHAPLYIRGGRYSNFMERHCKQDVPAAGAVIVLRDKKAPLRSPRSTREKNPAVYVVQLGFGPKIKSLMLVNTLRAEGIAVHQNLAVDSLSTQLREAEALGVKYTIIIGQKEYSEDSAILRDMQGQNQETIRSSQIVPKLRRIYA